MERGKTIFLRIAVYLIGIIVLALAIFYLPRLANDTAEMYPEFAYLKFPVLFGLYITVIPFVFAIYQALKLLTYIDHNHAFSEMSVTSLKYIQYCAIMISIIYVIGMIYFLSQHALHPGIAIIGFTIMFSSLVIAVFAMVLQKLLRNALDIKAENDLTV